MTDRMEEAMEYGARQYADILDLLTASGHRAAFTQTGGMCAAIEFDLEGERSVLITDANDPLAWEREDHIGWGVGLYDTEDTSEALKFESTADGSPEALLELLRSVIEEEGSEGVSHRGSL